MNAIDTNISLYVRDPRDSVKQSIAASLVEQQTDGVLLWQVACEYLAASRKLAPVGHGLAAAKEDIDGLRQAWSTAIPDWDSLDRGYRRMSRFSLSFWDALLIGTCLEAGVTHLYSEDFDAYGEIDGLTIINPFRTKS
jgi:predicted nucleic acid-binding protein